MLIRAQEMSRKCTPVLLCTKRLSPLLFCAKKIAKISILFLYNQKSSYFCAISYSKKRLDGKTLVIAILLHHLTTTCFIPQVGQSPPRLPYFLYIE